MKCVSAVCLSGNYFIAKMILVKILCPLLTFTPAISGCVSNKAFQHIRYLLVNLVISNFGFEGGTVVLVVSVSGHCLPFTFNATLK